MNARDFVYWVQGYFEILGEDKPLTAEQVKVIRNHLNMVFKHEIDPSFGDVKHQEELDKVHFPVLTKIELDKLKDDLRRDYKPLASEVLPDMKHQLDALAKEVENLNKTKYNPGHRDTLIRC